MIGFLSFDYTTTSRSSSFSFDNHHDVDSPKGKVVKQIKQFGVEVNWVKGKHYEINDLEPYRLVGDVELDQILELNSLWRQKKNDDKNENVTLRVNEDEDDEVSGNFSNTIEACAKIYQKYKHKHNSLNGSNEINNRLNVHLNKMVSPSSASTCTMQPHENAMFAFYQKYHDFLPSWVDFEQIKRGVDVFITFAPVAGQSLYYLSLVPGFSIPKIAKVLEQTRYLVPPSTSEQVLDRLMDTGGFVSNIMLHDENGLIANSLRPGGKAWTMALQVRTLHAKVRRSILRNKRIQWDIQEFGIPINQEDMVATLLAFSVNVLSGIEFVAGVPISIQEQKDYLALWRYIGWLLGIETEQENNHTRTIQSSKKGIRENELMSLNPCAKGENGDDVIIHSHALLESIILHLMHPNESSKRAARHLLSIGRVGGNDTLSSDHHDQHIKKKVNQSNNTIAVLYRSIMCRRFIGDELADALDIPRRTNFSIKANFAFLLTTIVLMVLRVYTLLTIKSCWFRKRVYKKHLRMIRNFDKVWSFRHMERMDKAAKKNQKSCPFALIKPPTHEDVHYKND